MLLKINRGKLSNSKKYGVLRITAPNAWLDYQAYKLKDRSFYHWYEHFRGNLSWLALYNTAPYEASIGKIFLHHMATQRSLIAIDEQSDTLSDIDLLNLFNEYEFSQFMDIITSKCFFDTNNPGNHMTWWTVDKVHFLLEEVGFSKIIPSGFGQSCSAVMRDVRLFDNTMPFLSFYIEAIK